LRRGGWRRGINCVNCLIDGGGGKKVVDSCSDIDDDERECEVDDDMELFESIGNLESQV